MGCRTSSTTSDGRSQHSAIHSEECARPPEITFVEPLCRDGVARFTVQAFGLSVRDGMVFQVGTLQDGTPWTDTYPLLITAVSCDMNVLEASLTVGVPPADAVAGESTPFACTDYDGGTLTFAMAVFTFPDGALGDCIVWGSDPDALVSGLR